MHESHQEKLNPSHPAPIGRLKLEVVDLRAGGVEPLTLGTGCMTSTLCGTFGCFADEE